MKKQILSLVKKMERKKILNSVFLLQEKLKITYPEELSLKKEDLCLVLAPHPDDESIGCGGLLLKYPDQTDVIFLTDGRMGDTSLSPDSVANMRRRELDSAMSKAGVRSYKCLDIPDTMLSKSFDQFQNIDISIYQYIFIPSYLDQHPDHKAVSYLLAKLITKNGMQRNQYVCFYEVWSTLPLVNYFVDLNAMVEEKRQLINVYKSQMKFIDYADKILSLNNYRGITVHRDSVEAFLILKAEVFLSLLNASWENKPKS